MTSHRNERPGNLYWHTVSKGAQAGLIIDHEHAPLIGYGKSFSSFGELVQGRFSNDEDFLVTMPIDLWSTCELICRPIKGPLVIECDLEKSRALLYSVLEELRIVDGFYIKCTFTRNIPVGKGLSSSTADMLAALRAIQEIFGLLLKESFVSRIFASVEPHDGVHYNSSVAYNHRKGVLLANYEYIPKYTIVAVDNGGAVDTVLYNKRLNFSDAQMKAFDQLYINIGDAFSRKDDRLIAGCATRSAMLYAERADNTFVGAAITEIDRFIALGMVAAHSGTCIGYLYERDTPHSEIERLVAEMRIHFKKEVFVVRTLSLLT